MEKLPLSGVGNLFTTATTKLAEGPYKSRRIDDLIDEDPLYILALVEQEIYTPSPAALKYLEGNAERALYQMTLLTDPDQYIEQ